MPASSFSAALNTGVYLLASGLFLGFALPVLDGVHKAAELQAITALAGGLKSEIDSLVPGMKTRFIFNSPGTTLYVHGRSIDASMDGVAVTDTVRWILPVSQLQPGMEYVISLSGGAVSFEESRGD